MSRTHQQTNTARSHVGTLRTQRRAAHDRRLSHGSRVVAVARMTATTVEVLGHGTYEHAPASPAVRQRLAEAIEVADGVAIDYEPMLDSLSRYMSADRAHQYRSQFHSRTARGSRSASERARQMTTHIRSHHQIRLDHGGVVGLDECVMVPAEEFAAYASGCTVVAVPS